MSAPPSTPSACGETWLLSDGVAAHRWQQYEGRLDLRTPAMGLALAGSGPLAGANILAIDFAVPSEAASSLTDPYVRGGDLIAAFAETAHRPSRVLLYWRTVVGLSDPRIDARDVQLSVQTPLWHASPQIRTVTNIAARCDAFKLEGESFSPVAFGDAIELHAAPCCLLVRFDGSDQSYVEMIHPSDFNQAGILHTKNGGLQIAQSHFAGDLEKGVILRSRVRAAILPRASDEQLAVECYRHLFEADPPLTA